MMTVEIVKRMKVKKIGRNFLLHYVSLVLIRDEVKHVGKNGL